MGIVLSGMGNDGAEGLLKMRQQGAYTISQRKDTCVIDSMPTKAYEMGASQRSLAPNEISKEIIRWAQSENYNDTI